MYPYDRLILEIEKTTGSGNISDYARTNKRSKNCIVYMDLVNLIEWANNDLSPYGYERYRRFYEELEMPVLSFEDYLACTRISEQTNTRALLYDCVPDDRKEAVL